jgi:hypothetical protein
VLSIIRWGQWVTLLFQVMPVFFLVGGYAAAVSWSGHRLRGTGAAHWLSRRAVRLLYPTAAYAALALAAVAVAIALKAPAATLSLVGWAIALQLWFLPVYLALTALTPALYAAHRRWGLAVPAALAGAGIAVDFTVIYAGIKPLGWLNYVLVWGAAYQTGFAWQDGTLTRDRRLLAGLAAGGALLFAGLVLFGPFSPSLIGVAGERVDNTAPPSAALVAYMAVQVSLIIAVAPGVSRWLRRPRPWRVVSQGNKIVMAVYLWHMVPAVAGGMLLYLTGLMPQPAVGSAEWWELRPVWIAILAALLALVLYTLDLLVRTARRVVSGRRRRRPADDGTPGTRAVDATAGVAHTRLRYTTVLWIGIAAAAYSLYRFAVYGFAPSGAFPLAAALTYAVGTALVTLGASPRRAA